MKNQKDSKPIDKTYSFQKDYAKFSKEYRPILFEIEFMYYELKSLIGPLICEKFGHNLTNNGYANSESGADDFYCSRCGFSHVHIYY